MPRIEDEAGATAGELLASIESGTWVAPASGPITVTIAPLDPSAPEPAPPVAGQQMIAEVSGASPQRLVIAFAPGALPGATPVDLAAE